jgi:hypothetical protein
MKYSERIEILAMSNLTSSDTGVDGVVIWVSAGEFSGKGSQHGPRIKVVSGSRITSEGLDKAATATLEDPPRFIGDLSVNKKKEVTAFIIKNRNVLLRYWAGGMSTREMIDSIVKS